MRILIFALMLAVPESRAASPDCGKPGPDEPVVYASDFKWGMSLSEMKERFSFIYESGKRLKGRAYYDAAEKAYVYESRTGKVRLTERFLKNVSRHIEIALERRYADFAFFPDMGHSHLFIPERDWAKLKDIPANQQHVFYERVYALPGLKVLYHTAEQLAVLEGERGNQSFPQNAELLWRYFSRNPVGDNATGENVAPQFAFGESYNTLRDLKGHHYYSAGFNISASKNGCFVYRTPDGKELRFDLSPEDLPYDGSGADY